jgi:hypothetical protein
MAMIRTDSALKKSTLQPRCLPSRLSLLASLQTAVFWKKLFVYDVVSP